MKTKTNVDYFQVKDYAKTEQKHHNRIVKLSDSYGIDYDEVMDNDSWVTIETMAHSKYDLWKSMGITTGKKQMATLINQYTREVIGNVLERWHEVPRSYDTAFYIMHYMKVREGMADLLGNFEDRGEI